MLEAIWILSQYAYCDICILQKFLGNMDIDSKPF
jgi:hypothetical protein